MNIYSGKIISEKKGEMAYEIGNPHTLLDWPITPSALYWGPKFYYERYNLPKLSLKTECHATITFLLTVRFTILTVQIFINRYLLDLRKASESGVEIDGYYVWSLIDNFEWAHGYQERFGLVYCDTNGTRIIKDSGFWHKNVIKTNGESLQNKFHLFPLCVTVKIVTYI